MWQQQLHDNKLKRNIDRYLKSNRQACFSISGCLSRLVVVHQRDAPLVVGVELLFLGFRFLEQVDTCM